MSVEKTQQVTIRPITLDNWKEAIAMNVEENQKSFVATNIYSLAESSFYETAYNYGIYQEEDMVGFILIFNPPDEPKLGHIVRFMIDKNHQKQGIGKKGLHLLINLFSTKYEKTQVTLTVIPENSGARKFYENIGFVNTEEIVEGELKYVYIIE